MRRVYMDNAATTRVSESVLEAMLPYFAQQFGNASSLHAFGREGRKAIDRARRQAAAALNCEPAEIYFTSCGSESDNWALRGGASALRGKGDHIITGRIEHPAVLRSCEQLEREGYSVTYLDVDSRGMVDPQSVREAITPRTVLISIMTANNEIGTIQPIEEIGTIAREKGILFHTDAVQAVGNMPLDLKSLPVDMLSLSGHKIHAPKGIGILYIRKGVHIDRFMLGGEQERAQRAGTENTAAIVGLGKALENAANDLDRNIRETKALRDKLVEEVMQIPGTIYNGHREQRLPGNASFSFRAVEGESLLLNLDMRGIAVSSGSACSSGSTEVSHVLKAIGLPEDRLKGTIRLTLSNAENTMEDVLYTAEALKDITARLRKAVGAE